MKAIQRIPTVRPHIVRIIETPAFVWALYIVGVVWLIYANLENLA